MTRYKVISEALVSLQKKTPEVYTNASVRTIHNRAVSQLVYTESWDDVLGLYEECAIEYFSLKGKDVVPQSVLDAILLIPKLASQISPQFPEE